MTDAYEARLAENPGGRFWWPQDLLAEVRAALARLTQEHCAYCDGGWPLGAASRETVDHFLPKSNRRFTREAFAWANLYLACDACQQAKRDTYDELLLRPDEAGYGFDAYFVFNALTGELEANPGASAQARARATRTIAILDLNRQARCRSRLRELRVSPTRLGAQKAHLDDLNYRFLFEGVPAASA